MYKTCLYYEENMKDNISGKNSKCVIVGSFRKHYTEIINIIDEFREDGIEVLSPKKSWIVEELKGFVILASDKDENEESEVKYIESKVLSNIDNASFIYLCNPSGYIGVSAAFEIGYAISVKKQIFASALPNDGMIAKFITAVVEPKGIFQYL
jgi:hypothetical protein